MPPASENGFEFRLISQSSSPKSEQKLDSDFEQKTNFLLILIIPKSCQIVLSIQLKNTTGLKTSVLNQNS